MITVPTVLVLGAGASIPYALPSGRELTRSVIDELGQNPSSLASRLAQLDGIDEDSVRSFANALRLSRNYSIDTFLGNNTDFMEVGKAAMAAILLRCERVTPELIDGITNYKEDWYRFLWNTLVEGSSVDSVMDNQLSIITFNYDRTLEYFLTDALMNTFKLTEDDASLSLGDVVPIVHVHGVLSGQEITDSTTEPNRDHIESARKTIKVLPESKVTDSDFDKTRKMIEEANRICFVGCAYHGENLRRLDFTKTAHGKWVFGTVKGLGSGQIKKVAETMGRDLRPTKPNTDCFIAGGQQQGCLGFLTEYYVLR